MILAEWPKLKLHRFPTRTIFMNHRTEDSSHQAQWIIHDRLSTRLLKSIKHRKLKITFPLVWCEVEAQSFLDGEQIMGEIGNETGNKVKRMELLARPFLKLNSASKVPVGNVHTKALVKNSKIALFTACSLLFPLSLPRITKLTIQQTSYDPVLHPHTVDCSSRDAKRVENYFDVCHWKGKKAHYVVVSHFAKHFLKKKEKRKEHSNSHAYKSAAVEAAWRHHVLHACFYVPLYKWITFQLV